jgi:hypothetical protein|tara:strand:+ start:212 stop:571 length:360 start_codon:yes stop_codon:yes gene_type:complete
MTMIKKKFEKIEDGINNMLDAAAHDYSKKGYTHRTSEEFRSKFMIKPGQKYIKIGRISDHTPGRMGQVWGFVVGVDNDPKFKKGDVLKAAGYNAPARNAPRGNVLEGGFNINWTGPEYL